MSDPCTKCGWFNPEKFLCTRVNIGREGGVKVMRPDVGACLYWKPSTNTNHKQGTK